MFRRAILVACFLFWPAASHAQFFDSRLWFVRGGVTPGFILPTNPFGIGAGGTADPIHVAPNLTMEIGRRTDGTSAWHELYGTPSYGFGFSLVPLPNSVENSHPIETYGFFSWPFARLTDRLQVTSDFGMGLSWHWKRMNEATEAYENVLGSNLNVRVNWGFYARYLYTPRVAIYSGVDYTHRSNGGMVQPDFGINVIGPKVTVQYNFTDEAPTPRELTLPPFVPRWEVLVGGLGGMKNVVQRKEPLARANFGAFAITSALQRHFYRFGKVTAGTDVIYDGSTGARVDGADTRWRAGASQRWGLGIYGGYEHVIGRFGALVQVGDTVARGFANPHAKRLYTRYGWRYQVTGRVWSTFTIRANGFWRANVLEFGVGYRLRRAGP